MPVKRHLHDKLGSVYAFRSELDEWVRSRHRGLANPLAHAMFEKVTDLGGAEQAAAVSRDGRFLAFLSDRDGRMDVWVTQIGTGQFYNLTRGLVSGLVNPSVRTLGFSPRRRARHVLGSRPQSGGCQRHWCLGGADARRTAETLSRRRG